MVEMAWEDGGLMEKDGGRVEKVGEHPMNSGADGSRMATRRGTFQAPGGVGQRTGEGQHADARQCQTDGAGFTVA